MSMVKLTPEGWPIWPRTTVIDDEEMAEASRIMLKAYEDAALTLPEGNQLRAHFHRDATAVRTQLTEYESRKASGETS